MTDSLSTTPSALHPRPAATPRRVIFLAVAGIVIAALAGCGSSNTSSSSTATAAARSNATTATQAATATTAPTQPAQTQPGQTKPGPAQATPPAGGAPAPAKAAPATKTCPTGDTSGVINGQAKCLAAGQECQNAHAADYTRYGFDCTANGTRYTLHSRNPAAAPTTRHA